MTPKSKLPNGETPEQADVEIMLEQYGSKLNNMETVTISPPPTKMWKKKLLNIFDSLISLVIVVPLVVGHWHGTWLLMDDFQEYFPFLNCFLLGATLHVGFALLRDLLEKEFSKDNSLFHKIKQQIFCKVYTYVFSISCNMHWRGGWGVMDGIIGIGIPQALGVVVVGIVLLLLLKSIRNLVAPPYVILTDSPDFLFTFPTRFRTESSRETSLYVLDCLFSVFVVGSLVVFVWRGAWVLLDLTIYPDDPEWSAWGSLALGYGIVAISFSLQPVMRWACTRLQGAWRVIIADLFLFFSFVGTVNVWRSVWQLLDLYFLKDDRVLSDWVTHSCCILLLVLLNCSNSVLVRGVYIDAEEPAGKCVVFPVYYLRLFFQKERSKKIIKKAKNIRDLEGDKFNSVPLFDKDKESNSIIITNLQDV